MPAQITIMEIIESNLKVSPIQKNKLNSNLKEFFKKYEEFHNLTNSEKKLLRALYVDSKFKRYRRYTAHKLGLSKKTVQNQITGLNKKFRVKRISTLVNRYHQFM